MSELFHSKYRRVITHHPYGPVTLTIYTPEDAGWIESCIHEIQVDLHKVGSAILSVGNSFIVLEREIDHNQVHFAAQSYRPADDFDESPEDIVLDVLANYPM